MTSPDEDLSSTHRLLISEGDIVIVVSRDSGYKNDVGFIYKIFESGLIGVMLNGRNKVQYSQKGIRVLYHQRMLTHQASWLVASEEAEMYFKENNKSRKTIPNMFADAAVWRNNRRLSPVRTTETEDERAEAFQGELSSLSAKFDFLYEELLRQDTEKKNHEELVMKLAKALKDRVSELEEKVGMLERRLT